MEMYGIARQKRDDKLTSFIQVLAEYSFDRLEIHDISIAVDGIRLLAVATLLESSSGFKSSRCRAEKRIIGM